MSSSRRAWAPGEGEGSVAYPTRMLPGIGGTRMC